MNQIAQSGYITKKLYIAKLYKLYFLDIPLTGWVMVFLKHQLPFDATSTRVTQGESS